MNTNTMPLQGDSRKPAAVMDINTPQHVDIETMSSIQALLQSAGEQSLFGTGSKVFFGTAYVQGNRLMFSTAMPIDDLTSIAKADRAKKRDTILEVDEHSNRPKEEGHSRNLGDYLRKTACVGENWIIPSLTLNFGCDLGDDDEHVRLIIVGNVKSPSATSWPAILQVPPGARFDITDGAHREGQFTAILSDLKIPADMRDRLRQNSVSVNFVFEKSKIASHQDFADCAKAKSIQKSLVVTYDVRDETNRRTRELVKAVPFLTHYVDATAGNVNLSGKSARIWSMSAMRMFANHVNEAHEDKLATLNAKMDGAEKFFGAAIKHIPTLAALAGRLDNPPKEDAPTTASLREVRGGNILLRGVGIALLARAFLSCTATGIPFDGMTKALGMIDWHVLKIDKPKSDDPEFQRKITENLEYLFSHMVLTTETRMKISSAGADADIAWQKITAHNEVAKLFASDLAMVG